MDNTWFSLCLPSQGLNIGKYVKPIYGQESPGWISQLKFVTNTFFWQLLYTLISLLKFIGQWIPVGKGRWLTRDILNIHFHFQHSTTGYKVVTIYKTKMLERVQFCKLSQLCILFCKVLKMKVIVWNIFSNSLPFANANSLTNQFYQKS